MSNPYLLLWLEAPLQAWGYDSRFGRRDSLDFPTKSGLLGLICCARGVGDEQIDWLAAWANLDVRLEAFVPKDSKDQPLMRQPLLRDFHMVGSGYDDRDPWQSLLIPKKSDGGKAVGGGTKMTYRYYLQDMAYAVALEVPQELVETTAAALQTPVWDLFLGRKNCVPTDFIYRGLFDDADAALAAGRTVAQEKNRAFAFRVLQGEQPDADEVITLNDVPLQFGPRKLYRDRRVSVQRWE